MWDFSSWLYDCLKIKESIITVMLFEESSLDDVEGLGSAEGLLRVWVMVMFVCTVAH